MGLSYSAAQKISTGRKNVTVEHLATLAQLQGKRIETVLAEILGMGSGGSEAQVLETMEHLTPEQRQRLADRVSAWAEAIAGPAAPPAARERPPLVAPERPAEGDHPALGRRSPRAVYTGGPIDKSKLRRVAGTTEEILEQLEAERLAKQESPVAEQRQRKKPR